LLTDDKSVAFKLKRTEYAAAGEPGHDDLWHAALMLEQYNRRRAM
jgi:hypothetical protein